VPNILKLNGREAGWADANSLHHFLDWNQFCESSSFSIIEVVRPMSVLVIRPPEPALGENSNQIRYCSIIVIASMTVVRPLPPPLYADNVNRLEWSMLLMLMQWSILIRRSICYIDERWPRLIAGTNGSKLRHGRNWPAEAGFLDLAGKSSFHQICWSTIKIASCPTSTLNLT
jgi:hypothetical protein